MMSLPLHTSIAIYPIPDREEPGDLFPTHSLRHGRLTAALFSLGPGGALKARCAFTGQYTVYDTLAGTGVRLFSGMSFAEAERAARSARVTFKRLDSVAAKVGDVTAHFKNGRLREIEQ